MIAEVQHHCGLAWHGQDRISETDGVALIGRVGVIELWILLNSRGQHVDNALSGVTMFFIGLLN
jgi:hypothetical protein